MKIEYVIDLSGIKYYWSFMNCKIVSEMQKNILRSCYEERQLSVSDY